MLFKYFDFYVNVYNLTNRTFIGYIGTSDGVGGGTYYVGAPFTISAGINITYF